MISGYDVFSRIIVSRPSDASMPWWHVIKFDGGIAFGNQLEHKQEFTVLLVQFGTRQGGGFPPPHLSAETLTIWMQLIFYPTAIGSEPQDPNLNSYLHWCRVMMGHSGANLVRCRCSARP